MVGAWEQRQANSVLTYILHVDFCTVAWAFGLKNLIMPGPLLPIAGMPYDMARNTAVAQFLQSDCQFLFSLDSDVIPPRDTILRLMAHNQPVISGLYCRRSPPHGVPVMIKNGTWVTNYPRGSIVDVDLVGAGCLLIRRDVLERLPPSDPARGKTAFDWRVDMAGLAPVGDCLSEDFSFCKRVREQLGVKVLVDTSIECRHVGFGEASYGNFQPMNSTPVT